MNDVIEISSWVIPLVLAITMHEAAHGFVANMLGDPTAKLAKRVSINPFRHIDRVGTILLPGLLLLFKSPFVFGYAKPVPVDFRKLRHPRRDSFFVAIAGPVTNLILGFASALLLHIETFVTPEQAPWTFLNLYHSVMINAVLTAFNMIPLLPLDGGRVLNALLPPKVARVYSRTERYGLVFVMLLLLLPAYVPAMGNLNHYLIGAPAGMLRDGMLHAAGIGNSSEEDSNDRQ